MSERELARELPDCTLERIGDARAQLWARVYAAEFAAVQERWRDAGVVHSGADAVRERARDAANAAVRDFDEHYLGGKR